MIYLHKNYRIKTALSIMKKIGEDKVVIVDDDNKPVLTLTKTEIRDLLTKGFTIYDLFEDVITKIYEGKVDMKSSQKKRKEPVLITGGFGYIGMVLIEELLKRGYELIVLDNLFYKQDQYIDRLKEYLRSDKIEFVNKDIRDVINETDILKEVNTIIHLAAIVGEPATLLIPREAFEINYLASVHLYEAAKHLNVERFIFASTCSVYGFKEKYITEDSEIRPLELYARSKSMVESYILNDKDSFITPVILRFGTAYGYSPRMRFDLAVNLFVGKAFFEKEISVYGDGTQWRPFVHVRDIAKAIIKAMEAPTEKISYEIFNVGSNRNNYRIIDVAEKIKEVVSKNFSIDVKITFKKEIVDKRSYKVRFDKIKTILGFETEYSIEDAVIEIGKQIVEGNIKNYRETIYNNRQFVYERLNKQK